MRDNVRDRRSPGGLLRWPALILLMAAFVAGGCGDDGTGEAPTAPAGPSPVGLAGTEAVESGDFPGDGATALLTAVRVAPHDGFDRIVFEFDGSGPPAYRVGYIDPPAREDGSGAPVDVAGEQLLEIRMTPASGFDMGEVQAVYTGPDRIAGRGTAELVELVRTGDFEAGMAWVAGTRERAPFAVGILERPTRVVVDLVDEP
jgi:hypothetical protein